MIEIKLSCEDIKSSRRMQGKRALAVFDTCKIELKMELPRLFRVFGKALEKANNTINKYPPEDRSRCFEASIMQTAFMSELKREFSENVFFGKYKRIILRKNGYIILFKKLNKKGMPMNIKTMNVQHILNQNQTLDLFANSDYNDEPILFFGYQKNRYGDFENPQLVYIDEGEICFNITQNDIDNMILISLEQKNIEKKATPKLKNIEKRKEA
ncbi:MAG: hypothetical protein ACTTJM_00075 [Bergeyella cardium]